MKLQDVLYVINTVDMKSQKRIPSMKQVEKGLTLNKNFRRDRKFNDFTYKKDSFIVKNIDL